MCAASEPLCLPFSYPSSDSKIRMAKSIVSTFPLQKSCKGEGHVRVLFTEIWCYLVYLCYDYIIVISTNCMSY